MVEAWLDSVTALDLFVAESCGFFHGLNGWLDGWKDVVGATVFVCNSHCVGNITDPVFLVP